MLLRRRWLCKGNAMEPFLFVRVRVQYQLGEYLRYVQCRTALRSAYRRRSGLAHWMAMTCRSAVAPLEFLGQWVRQGALYFHIDKAGVRRRARDGVICVPWSEVTFTHATAYGFLLNTLDGWMFLPSRVLSASQKQSMESMFQFHAQGGLQDGGLVLEEAAGS